MNEASGAEAQPRDDSPESALWVEAKCAAWLQTCLARSNARYAQDVAELDRAAKALRGRLQEIESSTTWRASAPLRSIVTAGRSARGRLRDALARPRQVSERAAAPSTPRARARPDSQAARATVYERWIDHYDNITASDIERMRDLLQTFGDGPSFSVLLRRNAAHETHLRAAIESVQHQVYPRWELCIAIEDARTIPVRVIEDCATSEPRVTLVPWFKSGVTTASNALLDAASGDWIVLLDDDALLRPHSLLLVAMELAFHPDADFVYSDEDNLDGQGRRIAPDFKPDWNSHLLLGRNYVGHLSAFRRRRAHGVGGFRKEFDDSEDYDLFLRLLRDVPPDRVRHIPHVLYHSRPECAGADSRISSTGTSGSAARRAVTAYLEDHGEPAEVWELKRAQVAVQFAVPDPAPEVDVIVPTTARSDVAGRCLDDLLHATAYPRLRVILACSDGDVSRQERTSLLDRVTADDRVTVLTYPPRSFSWAWTNNFAARKTTGAVLCFLNDDTAVIRPNWLDTMVGYLMRDGVGAVGSMLYYPDDTVQHGGVIIGRHGLAGHRYVGLERSAADWNGRALLTQELSAVTGACMVVRREAFESVGGFDETLAIAFNDIDFCLRLRKKGWKIVWTPNAALYHRESTSIGLHYSPERRMEYEAEYEIFRDRWGSLLMTDPFYNPNLALDSLGDLAFPPRVRYPWLVGVQLTT